MTTMHLYQPGISAQWQLYQSGKGLDNASSRYLELNHRGDFVNLENKGSGVAILKVKRRRRKIHRRQFLWGMAGVEYKTEILEDKTHGIELEPGQKYYIENKEYTEWTPNGTWIEGKFYDHHRLDEDYAITLENYFMPDPEQPQVSIDAVAPPRPPDLPEEKKWDWGKILMYICIASIIIISLIVFFKFLLPRLLKK